ncbi:hypothetical protein GF325_16995 [Candidatus Bathyarchaeota archaeon]|nr:hypothetical protein [Candidatus Bathyarchaeota archaeon]
MAHENGQERTTILKKVAKATKVPAFLGICIGITAGLIQALIGFGGDGAGGPVAYGFCVACHTRDMTNTLVNAFFGAALFAALPVLTLVGLYIGGRGSAHQQKEFRIKKSKWHVYLFYTLGGIGVMVFALFLGGCPYRAALRVGYGDLTALIGILGIIGGVAVGAVLIFKYLQNPVFRRDA